MGSGHGDPGLSFVGVLLLAALGTFVWNTTPPLDSARPSGASSEHWTHHELSIHIPARLWQDPFSVMQRYLLTRGTSSAPPALPGEDLPRALNDYLKRGDVTILAVMLNPGIYPALIERRRRRRYAVLSGLAESRFVPKDAGGLYVFRMRWSKPNTTEHSTADCTSIAPGPSSPCVNIPYEWYTLRRPAPPGTGTNQKREKTVLVLWLNETRFKADFFGHFKQLLLALHYPASYSTTDPPTHPLNTVVLGPAGSDTLRTMVRKPDPSAIRWIANDSKLDSFTILSPTATAADCRLLPSDNGPNSCAHPSSRDGTDLAQYFDDLFCSASGSPHPPTEMRFVRTIHSDNALLAALWHELTTERKFEFGRDTALVISEWDTFFGRALQKGFSTYERSAAPHNGFASYRSKPQTSTNNRFLLQYTYQRGIDGIIPGTHIEKPGIDATTNNPNPADATSGTPFLLIHPANVRRPVGTGQYDYLRRMAVVIRNEDWRRRLQYGAGIRVGAVLGSDVYDKLLILHALRFELPGTIWVTTDLDANFLHPSDFSAVRNMIVASTYGLRLRSPYQLRTAPFRDSYQTSVFLSTRLAVDNAIRKRIWPEFQLDNSMQLQKRFYRAVPVRLFEVGRRTFVPLWTNPADSGATCSPRCLNDVARSSYFRPIAMAAYLLGLLGIVVLGATLPRSARLAGILILGLAGFGTIIGVSWLIPDEPHLLTAGVSVWPTEYLRTAAIVVTCLFFWSTCERLAKSWATLNYRYFDNPGKSRSGAGNDTSLRGVPRRIWHDICSMRRCSRTCTGVLATLLPVIVLVLIGLPYFVAAVSKALPVANIWVQIFLPFLIWMLANALWWALTRPRKPKWLRAIIGRRLSRSLSVRSVIHWDRPRARGQVLYKQMEAIWHDYGKYGQMRHRLLRCTGYTLLYLWVASIVFAVFGWTPSPARGTATIAVDHVVTVVSVLLMLFLLFFVLDSIRLCVVWISLIRKYGPRWPDRRAKRFGLRHRLSRTDEAGAWLTVHLIGERTGEVSRTIYYPILVILMLLAARNSYFTNWDFPHALAIVIGIYFVIAVGSAVYLGYEARAARRDVIERLQFTDDERCATTGLDKDKAKSIDALVTELLQLQTGAYQRFLDQPTVRATLLVLGGIGLTYAQYLPLH